MRKPSTLVLLFVFLSHLAFSQTIKLYGTIRDEKDSVMSGVVVSTKDKTAGTQSDSLGHYELLLPPGAHQLEFTYLGYATLRDAVILREDQTERKLDMRMSDQAKDIDIVVVTGSKYEKKLGEEVVSMEVLKANVINQNSARMDEAVNKVPGVNMLGKSISIRGGSGYSDVTGNRVMALMDDVPILSPENGSIRWETVPIEELEQVEVIKGASSAAYGSSALNGVLNLRTVQPKPEAQNKILLNYGFYGQPRQRTWNEWWNQKIIKRNGDTMNRVNRPMFGGAQFLHAKQYGDWGVVVSGAYQYDRGFRQSNDYTRARLGAKLRYTPHKHPRLTVGLNMNVFFESLRDFFAFKGNATLTYVPMQVADTRSRVVSIDPYVNLYDKQENRHSVKFRLYNVLFNATTGDSSLTTQYYVDYSFLRRFKKIDMVLTAGASGSYANIKGRTFGVINSRYFNTRYTANAAAYIQVEKKFFKRLTISGGMRLEYARLDTAQVYYPFHLISRWQHKDSAHLAKSPVAPLFRFGVNYQVAEATYIRASIGQGFRYPAIAEKFVYTARSGAVVFPNPNLRPESGWSTELGIKQGVKISEWMAYFDVSGFAMYYKDMIEFQYYNAPDSAYHGFIGLPFQAVNITRARVLGVEVSALGNGKIFGMPFNFLVGYTYLDPENLNYNPSDPLSTKILKYRIQHSVKADAQAGYKGFTFGISMFYNSFMKNIDQSGIGLLAAAAEFRRTHNNGDFVMDIRAGYKYKEKVSFNFICKNILNREYTLRPGIVEAPRNFTFQVGYNF